MLTRSTFAFFRDLADNNSREWFEANKARYERDARKPMLALVEALIERIRVFEPTLHQTAKEAMFRINRDIRFSKDKSPYKTQLGAAICVAGKKAMGYPGFYIEVGANGVWVGGGSYMPNKEELATIRDVIADQGDALQAILADPAFVKAFGDLRGERNKIVPAEYRDVVTTYPLIANKQFYYMASVPENVVVGANAVEAIMEYYLAARPLQMFLLQAFA
ncbi:MAG: DUF2461 domain-containing protein [Candidatus Kapabacteria bacterium]|jgi:uncharacterized protein (TIGR02453 family)|nr:DUF2461 domain-containing protein [Candidatus Kapabacteria bacterium]